MKLFRTSIEQTGAAVLVNIEDGKEKIIPLFTTTPCEEAKEFCGYSSNYRVKNVFYANPLLDYRIEDLIEDFINRNGFLPENYIDELVCGFPFVHGSPNEKDYSYCYK